MGYDIISPDPFVQQRYEDMRSQGESHLLAEMLAFGVPPMSSTDREFLEGHCNGSQFANEPWVGDLYRRQAREAGVDPTGKVYLAGLARYPGDPEAWVTGRGDVRRRLEERGWGGDGAVTVAAREDDSPPPPPTIAPDLIESEVAEVLQTVPPADRPYVDVEDLRGQITEARLPERAY